MKKQVTFAESQTIQRLYQDEALQRITGMNESKLALKDAAVTCDSGLRINRPGAARCEPQQHVSTVRIPKTMTAAPFLKHAALTPAQREFLYTIAASHSTAHVRSLITQHYMNVLHRCTRAGYGPERDDLVVTSASLTGTEESDKHRSEVPSRAEKINTSAKNPGKSFLPKLTNRQARRSNASASKQRKMKKRTTTTPTSPTLRGKSPRRARIKLLEEEEEEDEGLDDSLSECLSSLSVGEWDDDTFSDL